MTRFYKNYPDPSEGLWVTECARKSVISGNKVASRLYSICRVQAHKYLIAFNNR